MSNVTFLPVALLIVGGLLLGGLSVFSWWRRSATSGLELTVLLVAAMVWVLAAAAEHLAPTLGGKILANKIQYLGILALPGASLVTVLMFIGQQKRIRPYLRIAIPCSVALFSLVATNEMHGLIWSKVELVSHAGLPLLALEYGPLFWVISFVSHIQLAAAAILLFPSAWKNWQIESTLIYVGFAAPWVANLLYISGLSPLKDLDITPFGLIITGVSFTISFHGVGSIFSTVNLANRDVVEHIADLIFVVDVRQRLISANRSARALLKTPLLPAPVSVALAAHPSLLERLLGTSGAAEEDVIIEISGERRIFDFRSAPISGRSIRGQGSVVVLRDATQQRAFEADLRMHRQQLRQIIDLIPHPIYARDEDGRFIIANDSCARSYGCTGLEMEGFSIAELHSDEGESSRILANDRRVIASQAPLTTEDAFFNGTPLSRTYKTTKIPFSKDGSAPTAIAAVSIDVTEERERSRQLHVLASTDPLTNLSNRRHFQEVLDQTLSGAVRTGSRAALLFMDLDRFKTVNDIYGHQAGDEVLRQVADRIRTNVRFSDEITRTNREIDGATISRFGGDEFMILLPAIEEMSDAAIVARRLIEALEAPFEVGSDRLQLASSVGIAVCPEEGSDSETLIRHCDQALTNAKRNRRGEFEFYNAKLSVAEERRHALEQGLRRALERNEFSVHFQPIRAASSAQLVGAEALLRWTTPELGRVGPDEFIPIAEETGLVVPIGLAVVRAVCEQMASWQERNLRLASVSINLSARQLVEPELQTQIAEILKDTGVSGGLIEFELTEGSVLSENPMVEETLAALQDMGSSLALDDFGTGYSSLSHLRRFSFQRLKIDRSFVNGLGSDRDDEQLVRAVIALAERLNIKTVAEGVETEDQLDFLRREGCDFIQGYLLGRPEPPEVFERLLEAEKPEAENESGLHSC